MNYEIISILFDAFSVFVFFFDHQSISITFTLNWEELSFICIVGFIAIGWFFR